METDKGYFVHMCVAGHASQRATVPFQRNQGIDTEVPLLTTGPGDTQA